MRRADKKKLIRKFLEEQDWGGLQEWAENEARPVLTLQALLFDDDLEIRHRAMEAIGRVCAKEFVVNRERVRIAVRNFFWLMNDESGGLLWNGPEVIAEVLLRVPDLIDEYGRMLANFLWEEPFERGAYFAVSRIAAVAPELFEDCHKEITDGLSDEDPAIRAFALSALDAVDPKSAQRFAESLIEDDASYTFYDFETHRMQTRTVGQNAGTILRQAAKGEDSPASSAALLH